MTESLDQASTLQHIYDEVRQRFADINDLAHGWEHVERVYTLARYLAQQEKANQFIVGCAALMHDLGRTVPIDENGEQRHHADLSVELASEILQRHMVPLDQQQAIIHAIVAHSFSKGIPPQTLEAGIVRDADRLDGLGAIGILRWAMVGEQRRTANTRSYHPTDPLAQLHTPDDRTYMLDHFPAKLLTLADSMCTETGRTLAQQRTDYMRGFLRQFADELYIRSDGDDGNDARSFTTGGLDELSLLPIGEHVVDHEGRAG
jgi:uncharacterized protein